MPQLHDVFSAWGGPVLANADGPVGASSALTLQPALAAE
jgi:hypothetical protein